MISEAAKAFLRRCFEGEEVRVIRPLFKEKYTINNKQYIFSLEVLEEMIASGQVKLLHQDDISVNLVGVEGQHSEIE